MAIVAVIALVACGDAATPEPQIVTERVEVPVTKIVTETVTETERVEVPVTKIVTETVTETERVEVPVTKIVTETVTETVEVQVTPVPAAKDTIVFSDLNWTSAQVQNRIAQYIVEHGYGYPTDLVFGGTLPLFQGLKGGDTHVTMEIWLPNQSIGWEEALELGEVVSVGKSLVGDWQSTFVIPAYIAEQYPDLKTPQDLAKPEFQELFSTADSRGMARLVACVPGWSCELVNDDQIEAYGLTDHLHVIKPGSQDAMFSEIFGSYEKEEPWLGYMWGTGDPALKLDLVRLEEPAYTKECWDSDKACAFDNSLVLVAVHKDLLPRAGDVIGFLQEWEFTIDIYKGIFQWMDANEGSTPSEAAVEWLNTKPDLWSSWVPSDVAERVNAALAAGEEAEGWPEDE
jgi:glycine betaine/proline transport system substrate-binding protein